MADTTLLTRRKRLAALSGISDSDTISVDMKVELDEHVAKALRHIYRAARWDFLRKYWRVELQAANTNGTVAVTGGATAWTGTSTAWDTTWATHVRLRAAGEVYPVASVDSSTTLTSTDAAIKTLTAGSSILYIDRYTLASDLEKIERIHLSTLAAFPMKNVSPQEMASMKSSDLVYGHPEFWSVDSYDASGYPVLELWPVPAYNEIMHIEGQKSGTVPTADGGTDDVPQRWTDVVDEWAKVFLYEYMEDPRYEPAERRARRSLTEMVSRHEVNDGEMGLRLDANVYGTPRHQSAFMWGE